jgi:hypothetical protein
LADVLKKFLKGENNNGQQGLSGKTVDTNELMLLVGGDSQIVKRIVKEISNEIPGIVQRLTDMIVTNDYAELKSSCHHMVSTFFPLGNENEVVKCISELSNNNLTGQEAKVAVLNLVDKIDGLHKDLKFTSNSLE